MPGTPIAGSTLRFDRQAIFTGGDSDCLLKVLYQNGSASDLGVVGYLEFIATKPLVITINISQNHKYPATF